MRRKKSKKPGFTKLAIIAFIVISIAVVVIKISLTPQENSVSSIIESSGSLSSSVDASPTPTTEPAEFWGNFIDLSATQQPYQGNKRNMKWPSEPGFEIVEFDLNFFKSKANDPLPLEGTVIFLDPGHGGEDLGAVFPRSPSRPEIYESRVNLAVALELKELLEASGAKVVLTRDTDYYYLLYYRSAIVAKYILNDFFDKLDVNSPSRDVISQYIQKMDETIDRNDHNDPADIFYPMGVNQIIKNILDIESAYTNSLYISLHCNASETPDTFSGTKVYYASNESVYVKQSGETKDIVFPEYQNYNDEARLRLANLAYNSIISNLPQMAYSKEDGAVQATDYSVIREINLVGILIEMGFVNTAEDRQILLDPIYQEKFAESIYDAVFTYFCG